MLEKAGEGPRVDGVSGQGDGSEKNEQQDVGEVEDGSNDSLSSELVGT